MSSISIAAETTGAAGASRAWHAAAKVNLALHVTGKRADGYHEVETFAVFTRFGDFVRVAEADADSFEVDGPFAAGVPVDGENLVIRARDALRLAMSSRPSVLPDMSPSGRRKKAGDIFPTAVRLTKNLPVASGVGGGSSDAAATLTALNDLWSLNLTPSQLAKIGQILGADVPMCLHGQPLLASGIGERIEPVAGVPPLALVLVNPGVAVSTGDVFESLARRDNGGLPPLPRAFDFHSLRNWLELTRNDLEPAARALQPVIGSVLNALNRADAGFARMSGSGATCFGLFETGNVAKRAAIEIRRRHPDWFVAATRCIPSEEAQNGD